MDSSQDKITTMQSTHYAVCKLVATILVAKFYYAHGVHLARQTLAHTFEQVLQVCLYLISALRNKNTHLTPPILVIAVQPTTTLLTDRGRKQTRVRNLVWLVDSLPASNDPDHLKLQCITDDRPGTVICRRFLAYGQKCLLLVLNISAASAGYILRLRCVLRMYRLRGLNIN